MKPFKTILPKVFAGLVLAWGIGLHINQISALPIVQWDESRLAINAVEMASNGNIIVTSFNNSPDLYNTKPPLMIWLQALSVKAFGINESSIRLPSIFAGIACIVLLMHYTYRQSKSLWTASLAGLILICSNGFIQLHGSLTGDYDALLTLFLFLTFMHWHLWLSHQNNKHCWYMTLFLALAILSKSAAAMIIIPIIGIQTIALKTSVNNAIRCFNMLALSILPFLVFIGIRAYAAPGYIQASLFNDFIGRMQTHIDGHEETWYYYFDQIVFKRFSLFWGLLPLSLIVLKAKFNPISKQLFFASIGYLLILTLAKTKIHWYDMPVLPLLSMVIALNVKDAFMRLSFKTLQWGFIGIIIGLSTMASLQKHKAVWDKQDLDLDYSHYELSHILRQYNAKDTLYLVAPLYAPEFEFYTHQHPQIKRKSWRELKDNDKVVLGNYAKDSIDLQYRYKTLLNSPNARIIQIQP